MEQGENQLKNELIPITLDNSEEADKYVPTEIDKKIKEYFPGEFINKKMTKKGILASRALPSFVADWLISKFPQMINLIQRDCRDFLMPIYQNKSKFMKKFKV